MAPRSATGLSLLVLGGVLGARALTQQERTDFLNYHNAYRCLHGMPALVWDNEIAAGAQAWATEKSENPSLPSHNTAELRSKFLGENYATGSSMTVARAVYLWYNEIEYTEPYGAPKDSNCQTWCKPEHRSKAIGHFTQVVWKSTTKLGCGIAAGKFTCRYGPAGNVKWVGEQHFREGEVVAPTVEPSALAASGCAPRGVNTWSWTDVLHAGWNSAGASVSPPGGGDNSAAPAAPPKAGPYGPSTWQYETLLAHNYFRCRHGVDPLAWDTSLEAEALAWAKTRGVADRAFRYRRYSSQSNGGFTKESVDSPFLSPYIRPMQVAIDYWYQRGSVYHTRGRSQNLNYYWNRVYHLMSWSRVTSIGCAQSPVQLTVCFYRTGGASWNSIVQDVRAMQLPSTGASACSAFAVRAGSAVGSTSANCTIANEDGADDANASGSGDLEGSADLEFSCDEGGDEGGDDAVLMGLGQRRFAGGLVGGTGAGLAAGTALVAGALGFF